MSTTILDKYESLSDVVTEIDNLVLEANKLRGKKKMEKLTAAQNLMDAYEEKVGFKVFKHVIAKS